MSYVIARSNIGRTDSTWNPVTGCTKISPGCKNCYAERMAKRLQAMGQPNYRDGFRVSLHERALALPLKWKKPQTIFVNSINDVFHEDVTKPFILRIFENHARGLKKPSNHCRRAAGRGGASSPA